MLSRRALLMTGAGAVAAALGTGAVGRRFRADLEAATARIEGRSRTVEARFGTLEYAEAGEGPPLLMVHGTGGGFDQGLAFARPLAMRGWRIVAPSRFGYLRSSFPGDPSSANQADVFADLLDRLGIDRIPIAGGSAGALSAIEFAVRHPDRCSALVAIVPATHVPGRDPGLPNALQNAVAQAMLGSDFLFWSAITALPGAMTGTILATDPALVSAASPAEQERVATILRDILPVSRRARGLLNDGRLAGNPAPSELKAIRAPTLAISLEDDRYGTAAAARHIAAEVPSAQLVIYPRGGHVWVGHDAELFEGVDRFLRESVRAAP